MTRMIRFNKFGITENPVGLYVSLPWKDRELLGEVVSYKADPNRGFVYLSVRHFCGDPWPVEPTALSVKVIE